MLGRVCATAAGARTQANREKGIKEVHTPAGIKTRNQGGRWYMHGESGPGVACCVVGGVYLSCHRRSGSRCPKM